MEIHGRTKIGCGNNITIKGGLLNIGKNFIANNNNHIICNNSIIFGNETIISHCVRFNDNGGTLTVGDKCWFGNNSSILDNSKIPNNTIIASYTKLAFFSSKEQYTIIAGQKATIVRRNISMIRNKSEEGKIHLYFYSNPKAGYYQYKNNISNYI